LWFGPPPPSPEEVAAKKQAEKAEREARKKPRLKNDPRYIAAARELRDRYIEQMNAPGSSLLLPPSACGKYDVSRQLAAGSAGLSAMKCEPVRLIDAA